MSQNLTPRDVEYRVKSGSRATLELTVNDSSGTAKNLSNTVTYALSATDTVIANAGNWTGEVELLNSSGVMSEQTKSFNFTIEESY